MADPLPYSVEVFYWPPRHGDRYEYVKVHRFATASEAAFFRARSLQSPPVPPDAIGAEIGEIRGPDLAREEAGAVAPPAALRQATGALSGRLNGRGV
jgi:hypothetical protein